MLAAQETNITVGQLTQNPHKNKAMCTACHISDSGGQDTLILDDIPQLCQSCHDGKKAAHEGHPVNLIPGTDIAGRMSSKFPLRDGKLTCSTCHNISWSCPQIRPAAMPNEDFLREASTPLSLDFCFNCHIPENYPPFNVHDQIDAGKLKTDACLWCHAGVPEVNLENGVTASAGRRGKSPAEDAILRNDGKSGTHLCTNCHSVPLGHPVAHPHINSKPSLEMLSYMSAYEIQRKMSIPVEQLIKYVQAPKRLPRSILLDVNGCITCYSCHNPHEKGLFSKRDPRSIGAEPKEATNHRLRSHEGDNSCKACHYN